MLGCWDAGRGVGRDTGRAERFGDRRGNQKTPAKGLWRSCDSEVRAQACLKAGQRVGATGS